MLDIIEKISKIGPHPGGSKEELEVAKFFSDSLKKYTSDVVTEKFDYFISQKLSNKASSYLNQVSKDILVRAAAFLLLKDSKASYTIEGETPPQTRIQRWGRAIGEAGKYPLSKGEFLRLQQLVIENTRFINIGWRKTGGFVGEHDRITGTPIPDHISAKWNDLESLISGLISMNTRLQKSDYDPVPAGS